MSTAHDRTTEQVKTIVRGPLYFLRHPYVKSGYFDFKNGLPFRNDAMKSNDSRCYEYGRFLACYDSSLRVTDFPKTGDTRVSNKALRIWISAWRAGYIR